MKFFPSFSALSAESQALRQLLIYLPFINTDFSSFSTPAPLLLPRSEVEYPAMVALHHTLFLLPTFQASPLDRAVSIFKNYICTLRVQANGCHPSSPGSTNDNYSKQPLKKPLSSFLGEIFVASAGNGGSEGETKIICEQVGHHPPVTASYLSNQKRGISIQAYLGQNIDFAPMSGGITIAQSGHALTHIENYNEHHLTTFPNLKIMGLLSFDGRNRHLEYSGTSWIVSSLGLITEIAFVEEDGGRGFKNTLGFGGPSIGGSSSRRMVSAKISRWEKTTNGGHKVDEEPLVTILGNWDGDLTIRYTKSGKEEIFETGQVPVFDLSLPSTENQTEWHSKKAWSATKDALARNDWKKAAEEKRRIEEWQRGLRRQEEWERRKWIPRYFRSTKCCEEAEFLLKITESIVTPPTGLGGPIWRYIQNPVEV